MRTNKLTSKVHGNDDVGVAYIRVSAMAGRDQEDILSPDSAIEAARSFYGKHEIEFNEPLSRKYEDINVSAYHEDTWQKRKGLTSLMAAARRGEIQHIAFFSVNRLARNLTDGFAIIAEFKRLGVTVHFITDPIPDSDNPAHEIVLASLLWAANMQSKSISTFLTAAIKEKQRRGIHHGSLVSWLTKDENGNVSIDQYWSKIYRLIVDLSLAGVSCKIIAEQMNNLGYVRPKGQKWTQKSVYDSLTPIYLEKMAGWDHQCKDSDRRRINERLKRIFPPLISDDEHKRLITMYHSRIDAVPDNFRKPLRSQAARGTKLATGLIRCTKCQKHFIAGGSLIDDKHRRIPRYKCGGCSLMVTGPMLEDALIRSLRQVLVAHRDLIDPNAKPVNEPLPEPEVSVTDIDKQMAVLLDMHLAGRVPGDLYDAKMAALVKEKADLEKAATEATMPELAAIIEDTSTDQGWRVLALAAISEASYPHPMELRSSGKLRNYNALRVTFKSGGTYLAPLYKEHYKGNRVLIKAA